MGCCHFVRTHVGELRVCIVNHTNVPCFLFANRCQLAISGQFPRCSHCNGGFTAFFHQQQFLSNRYHMTVRTRSTLYSILAPRLVLPSSFTRFLRCWVRLKMSFCSPSLLLCMPLLGTSHCLATLLSTFRGRTFSHGTQWWLLMFGAGDTVMLWIVPVSCYLILV